MWQQRLRRWLQTGPANMAYTHIRRLKRRLKHEPYLAIERYEPPPLSAAELREQIGLWPDNARLHYSLARAYLEMDTPESLLKSLACLRGARALRMEAEERLTLYEALICAKLGRQEEAKTLAASLDSRELTEYEIECKLRIETGNVSLPSGSLPALTSEWNGVRSLVLSSPAESLLIIGDSAAASAQWLPSARYLLAAPEVTGLTLEGIAGFGIAFALAVGTADYQVQAARLGVQCERWMTLFSPARE